MKPDRLHVQTFTLGAWQTNCYVVHTPASPAPTAPGSSGGGMTPPASCWIVDAGSAPQPIIDYVRRHHLHPAAVLLTHAHLDHIMGLADLRRAWPDVPILVHPLEREFLADPTLNLSAWMGMPVIAPSATGSLEHGQVLALPGVDLALHVRHTPGHSPGGVSFVQPESGFVLAGDSLFADSIGRTDFPTSDHQTLLASIQRQLYTLPDATVVLPGHGPA
ncbi:MAG: MBL fold metallo-hydrolase, partial [Phycisphaeraceae bacterium]|nr:MBL fold metallo-hydrolase [Phycisphaeraceae bacterium]